MPKKSQLYCTALLSSLALLTTLLATGCQGSYSEIAHDPSIIGAIVGYGPNGFINKQGDLVADLSPYHPDGRGVGYPTNELYVRDVSDYRDGLSTLVFFNSEGLRSGTLDKDGKIKMLPHDRVCFDFVEGLSVYYENSIKTRKTKLGFVDITGTTVIKPIFRKANHFSEGLAAVSTTDEHYQIPTWFYIDKTGRRITQQEFSSAGYFSEGVAVVEIDQRYGAIDKTGKEIVPAIFDRVYPTSEGIIVAEQGAVPTKNFREKDKVNIERFYFDKTGKKLFSKPVVVTWTSLDCRLGPTSSMGSSGRYIRLHGDPSFFNGLAIVQDSKTQKYGYMNKKGETVIAPAYDFAFPFSDEMAAVYSFEHNGRIAFIDHSGKQVTPFKFGNATKFSEGLAAVSEFEFGPYGFIDKKGKYQIWPIHYAARPFKEGRALVGFQAR